MELLTSPNRAQAASTMLNMFHGSLNEDGCGGGASTRPRGLSGDGSTDALSSVPPLEDKGLFGAHDAGFDEDEDEDAAHKPLVVCGCGPPPLQSACLRRCQLARKLILYCLPLVPRPSLCPRVPARRPHAS